MRSFLILLIASALLVANAASAETARKSGGNSAQLMQQMQQLAADRTALQQENTRVKGELEAIRKERDSLKKSQEGTVQRTRSSDIAVARAVRERESIESELARVKTQTEQLVAKFRDTIQELRAAETDRTTLRATLATRENELKSCANNNVALYKLNDEILTRWEGQGFWTSLGRAEPFTKLKRTQLENLADEYRGRAQDAQLPPPADKPTS